MRDVFRVIRVFAALFIFCFFSCARVSNPVTYEIIVPTDIYAGLSDEGFFRNARITELYHEKTAREIFLSDKYSVIVVDEAAEAVSPRKKPENVFVLAKVGYGKEMSAALGAGMAEKSWQVAATDGATVAVGFAGTGAVNTGGFEAIGAAGAADVRNEFSTEISRTYLYPCVPFQENMTLKEYVVPSGSVLEAEDAGAGTPEFYKLDDIPMGYVILPVRADGKMLESDSGDSAYGGSVFLADSPDYPLYESKFLKCEFFPVEIADAVAPSKPDAREEAVLSCYDAAANVCTALFNKELLPLVKQKPEPRPDVFFVAAVGDIILSRGVQEAMLSAGSPEPVFTNTIPILKNNDFTIGNLEGAVTARTENAQKTYTFKFNKKALPYLKQVGFDYLMLTNNHCYDYSEPGFKDTLEAVAAAGFATSGAGLNSNEASNFYRTEINGHAVSVLSFGAYPVEQSGFNGKTMAAATETRAGILWESDDVLDMIREEKKTGALIIVNIHGGSEYVTKPTKSQRTLYEKVCDAGADVVFGSHPHVLQPVEWYSDSLIVWSLGNFVFPGMEEMAGATDTMIVRLGFVDGRLLYYEKFPAYIDETAVRLK